MGSNPTVTASVEAPRSLVNTGIAGLALVAFTYYPDKHLDEPGYTIDEDLEWCAESMTALPIETQQQLMAEIRMLVLEPTRDRQAFIKQILSLAESDIAGAADHQRSAGRS